jgi:hypothetical protein
MFQGWENYFYLTGSSAAALIGLIFIVITLTAGQDPRRVSQGAPVYVTPIIFHFAVVLVVSALSQVPRLQSWVVGLILGLCAISGIVYSVVTTIRLCRSGWEDPVPELSDKCFYGFLPTTCYIALAISACAIWFLEGKAVLAVGAIVLVLLLIGIRNAWDLAMALAQRTHERR